MACASDFLGRCRPVPHGAVDPLRAAFFGFLDAMEPERRRQALVTLCDQLGHMDGSEEAPRLAALLRPSALTRAALDQRRRGATSQKIALAQVHRHLSRSTLGAVSALWLLEGAVLDGEGRTLRYRTETSELGGRPTPILADWRAGAREDFRHSIAELVAALSVIGLSRPRIAAGIRESNAAIAILSPWFVLRKAGAPRAEIHDAMRSFLREVAPGLTNAIDWTGNPAGGVGDTYASLGAPIRATCCLKYAAGPAAFCGTCPLRDD